MSDSSSVVLITGGSRGIGKACVSLLAQEGFRVAFTYASNQAAADALVADLSSQGAEVMAMQANAADKNAFQPVLDAVLERWGKIDGLVNNAGITRDGLLIRMSDDAWQEVIDTNLSGIFYATRAAAKVMMKQRSGRIINISSIVGLFGNAGQINYSASKAGIIGLTKSAAKELGSRNITVNAIAPGFISTEMTEGLDTEAMLNHIPLKRLGQGEDIARTVQFLLTHGSYITGQVIQVDGGLVL